MKKILLAETEMDRIYFMRFRCAVCNKYLFKKNDLWLAADGQMSHDLVLNAAQFTF